MIICAAIKIQVEGLDHETIIPCHRHGDGFKLLKDLRYIPRIGYKELGQGFINHEGEFLNRQEAFSHALDCGQLSATTRECKRVNRETELYSEDLY